MRKSLRATRTRREFLEASIAVPAALALASSGGLLIPQSDLRAAAAPQPLPATPACGGADDTTPRQTEGPFFRPSSPQRTSLIEPGMSGTRLSVIGYVLTTTCRPIPRALVDFWQCDDRGQYDNTGFTLRGHQFTDAAGRYSLETIVPGLYPGRTRHIHVKVQAPNRPVLTTQLYFPGEARNQSDGIFNQGLIVTMRDTPTGKGATFNFILDVR